jgi:hypothetical protein
MDKQELPINNPAERLYVILTRAAESSPEALIEDVLCTSMELEPNDENFIKGFSELLILLEKTEEQIQECCLNRKKSLYYSKAIQEIKKNILSIIKIAYDNQTSWGHVGNLSDPNWIYLESLSICIEDFEEREIIFNQDRLIELINDVETWMKEIGETQLDEDIKQFFIHKLMEIKHLLEKYYYHGSSRIQKEIYATLMQIGIHQKNLPEDKKEENKNFFTAIYEKLSELSKGLDLVNKPMTTVVVADKLSEVLPPMLSQTAEIITNVVKHLPPGI